MKIEIEFAEGLELQVNQDERYFQDLLVIAESLGVTYIRFLSNDRYTAQLYGGQFICNLYLVPLGDSSYWTRDLQGYEPIKIVKEDTEDTEDTTVTNKVNSTDQRFQVWFSHSSDKSSAITDTCATLKLAKAILRRLVEYNATVNQIMYVQADGLECAYYNESGKWGFRYWIVDTQEVLVDRDLSQDELDRASEWSHNNPVSPMDWGKLMASEPAIAELFGQDALDYDDMKEDTLVIKSAPYYLGLDYSTVNITPEDRLNMRQQDIAYTCGLEVIALMERESLTIEEKYIKLGAIQFKYDKLYNAVNGHAY